MVADASRGRGEDPWAIRISLSSKRPEIPYEVGRNKDCPLFPGFWEEPARGLGGDSRHLLLKAYVPPREELHFFFTKSGSQKKLEEKHSSLVACSKKTLQLFRAISLGHPFHVARPVPAPQ